MWEKVFDFDEEYLFELEKLVRKEFGLFIEVFIFWIYLKNMLIK